MTAPDKNWVELSANDLACLQAGGADVLALGGLAHERANALDIGVPTTLGASVRVRDAVPEAWALTADVAVSRHRALLSCSGQIPFAPEHGTRSSLVLDAD